MEDLLKIIDHSYDGIFILNSSGEFLFANLKSVERISGIPQPQPCKDTEELKKAGIIVDETIFMLPESKAVVVNHKLKSGVDAFITAVPVIDDQDNVNAYIVNYREMIQLQKLKEELEEVKSRSNNYLKELSELRNRVLSKELITRNIKMLKILETVINIAPTDANVCISGESGVGKEVVVKLIHKMSDRKNGPFIQVNCGAIPENLLESELFGYEKGSFTGAHSAGKVGLLETAHRGTFLLDEIGDLPLNLQVKLLKAIQDRVIYRVGGIKPVSLDIRIICATNKNLEEMVRDRKFREDLYYRINVIPIKLPPLRERKEDIIPLAYHFLEKYCRKYSKQRSLSVGLCKVLQQYDWPGNIRELENNIERLVIIGSNKTINLELLPDHIASKTGGPFINPENENLKNIMRNYEHDVINEALEKYGSIRQAAKHLGVNHATIIKKIKEFKNAKI